MIELYLTVAMLYITSKRHLLLLSACSFNLKNVVQRL